MNNSLKDKVKEWISVQLVRHPGRMVLAAILLFNVVFFFISAGVISALSLDGTEQMSFIEAAYCTVTMILDAGCIQFVVEDIGQSGVAITAVCLVVILVGMITFTGAVIGYITNYISHFVETANTGKKRLHLSDHTVIINWNTRASEIVNDLLYSESRQTVVVLVPSRKEAVIREVEERLADTLNKERRMLAERYKRESYFVRRFLFFKNRLRKKVTVLVREGDVYSSKQLRDICLERARAVIILGNDATVAPYKHDQRVERGAKGNSQTVKTLMQVAEISCARESSKEQKIIVEITDDWTEVLVNRIITAKQKEGKCRIVPVRVNKVLGQILAQFSLMPELNLAYRELFSNKGTAFYSLRQPDEDEISFVSEYLARHKRAIPLTTMTKKGETHCYYTAVSEKDILKTDEVKGTEGYGVSLNPDYWLEQKNVVILGHNSKCRDIMRGFENFCAEWNKGEEQIANILVIDDKLHLEKMGYYKDYPFVRKTVCADVYQRDLICQTISEFIDANAEDTSILILSDDSASSEDIDAGALANLVYVQDIIDDKVATLPGFDRERVDVVVEIIDPKNHDVVNGYSVNNVVISNRYISKMITQISEKEALFDFYNDILTYDDMDSTSDSKEVYVKKVSRLFTEIPEDCTAEQLIRALFEASIQPDKQGNVNPTLVLGYVKPGGEMVLFGKDQAGVSIHFEEKDKLILFCSH